MNASCLLCSFILVSISFPVVYAHMIIEDEAVSNDSFSASLQEEINSDAPPVVTLELLKTSKSKKPDKKPKQNHFSTNSKRPPPPANCVPLWGNCKTANSVCCEYCAFCQCRLFKTVCFCRMGNPKC